ncbi:MAG: hypothetical protein ACKOEO_03035 [Planctomycetaceae bacterium]
MLRKLPITTLLLSTLLAGGCSSARTLSRRDYEDTRDPFMQGSGGGTGAAAAGSTGVASLDDSSSGTSAAEAAADSRGASPLTGPKPIRQAAAVQEPRTAGSGIARASYPQPEVSEHAAASSPQSSAPGTLPNTAASASSATSPGASSARSWQGPALSNFLSGREQPPSETISGESVRSRTAASTASVLNGTSTSGRVATRPSPAAEAAALSEMNREIGGFSSFLEQSADGTKAAAQEAGRVAESTATGAAESAGNFADFAARKRAEWAAQSRTAKNEAKQTADALKSSAAAAVDAAGNVAQSASDDFFEQLAAPQSDVEHSVEESPSFDAKDAPSTETLDAGFSGQPSSIPAGFEP